MSTETMFISTPLETEHVERIKAAAGDAITVIHEPDLHPPTRFIADHGGVPGFTRTAEQAARWTQHLQNATILVTRTSVPISLRRFRA